MCFKLQSIKRSFQCVKPTSTKSATRSEAGPSKGSSTPSSTVTITSKSTASKPEAIARGSVYKNAISIADPRNTTSTTAFALSAGKIGALNRRHSEPECPGWTTSRINAQNVRRPIFRKMKSGKRINHSLSFIRSLAGL